MNGRHWLTFVLVAAPLALGAVHQESLLVITAVAGIGLLTAMLQQQEPTSLPRVTYVLLGMAGLMLFQAAPLPESLLTQLVPVSTELRAFALADLPGTSQAWNSLSVAPAESCLAAVRVLAGAVVLAIAYIVTRATGKLDGVAQALALSHGAVLAVLVGHQALALDAVYGVYPLTRRFSGVVSEPFINPNHLATFFLLTTPVTAVLALRTKSLPHRTLGLVGVTLGLVALLATGSRTGLAGLIVGLVSAAGLRLLQDTKLSVARWGKTVLIGGGSLAAALGLTSLKIGGALSMLFRPEVMFSFDTRAAVWRDSRAILNDAPFLGIGPGSFVDLLSHYRQGSAETLSFRFAESTLLQLVIDLGWVGGLLALTGLAAALVPCLYRCLRSTNGGGLSAAFLVSLATVTTPTLISFPFAIPALALPVAAILGGLLALHPKSNNSESGPSGRRHIGIPVITLVVALGAWLVAVPNSRETNQEHLEQLLVGEALSEATIDQAISIAARHPVDPWAWLDIGLALMPERPQAAMTFINRAMYLAPNSPQPHKVTAETLIRLGRPEQAILEYGLALDRTRLKRTKSEFHATLDVMLAQQPSSDLMCRAAPRRPAHRAAFARKLLSTSYRDCAMQLLRELHELNHPEAQVSATLAGILFKERNWQEAHDVAAGLAASPMDTGRGALLAAQALKKLGRSDESEEMLKRATVAESSSVRRKAVARLGRTLAKSGRMEALQELVIQQRALAHEDPKVLALCLHLEAIIAEKAGRPSVALRLWQRAQDMDPENSSYRKAIERIQAQGR
ncbi:MAG: hypothetical protein CL928_15200 [Deltaproteobacteria bacterium]|nr:hypothetical protein [Deltaproteobacteria bacterium]